MSDAVEQFVKTLSESKILSSDEIDQVHAALRTKSPSTVDELTVELIQSNVLTQYQAEAISRGEHQNLTFGEYVVLDELGQGGMGLVWRAKHRRMDREVAIKVLGESALTNAENVARFHKEVRAAAKLSHPNIVRAYDAGEHNGMTYLAMEYVDGRDLARTVDADGPLPISATIDYAIQIARGLAYAHSQGLIHRDIKPQNLILDRQGIVRILDLGLARFDQSSDELTKSDQIMGTVAYMSPEQAADTRQADARSDIYSLGCTLFCLLTGRTPYSGRTLVEHVLAHRDAEVPSTHARRNQVSPALDDVVTRMMAKDPAERFQTMDAVVAALGNLDPKNQANSHPVSADEPTTDFSSKREELNAKTHSPAPAGGRKVSNWGKVAVGILAICVLSWGAFTAFQNWNGSTKNERGLLIWKQGRADVLHAIDPKRDNWAQTLKGRARFEGDVLAMPSNSRVLLRYALPEEYRLELKIKREAPVSEPVLLIISRPGSLFGLVIGTLDETGEYASGLQTFGKVELHPPTVSHSTTPVIIDEQLHDIKITVRRRGIRATVDGVLVLDWDGGFEPFPSEPTTVKSLAFTTNHAQFQIHHAEVVDLTTD